MDFSSFLATFLLFISTYAGYLLYQRYKQFQIFRDMGVPGPKPSLWTGNMTDLKFGTTTPLISTMKWQKEFGKVYGYFRGTLPTLVVSDFDLIKLITVKDFSNFVNRPQMGFAFKLMASSLIGLQGETWKGVRKTLSPTFCASKMKQLANIMNKTVSVFCDQLEKKCKSDEEFDIYDNFRRLTLEVIGECALALKLECQTKQEDFMYRVVQNFTRGSNVGSKFILLLAYVPGLKRLLASYYQTLPEFKMVQQVLKNLTQAIEERRAANSSQKTIDILQLMLDAGHETDLNVIEEDDGFISTEGLGKRQRKPLTDDQIIANCWIFILAGYETTSTALAYTAHILSTRPDIQDKVYQEIQSKIKGDKVPTYEDAHNLQYLDQVINETLRIYPPVVLFMTRVCARDYDLNGITIPAGMKIEIPIYCIHHDPELWPDPEKFDPERFSPENKSKIHPLAHIPFGAGPRNCIGMRFALLEAKLTLIRLLRNYRLVPSSKTKDPPEVTVPHATYVPKDGIFVKVERRT